MALRFLLNLLHIFAVKSIENPFPALRLGGFWKVGGHRRYVLVTVHFGQVGVQIIGIGSKLYDVTRIGIGHLVFFKTNPEELLIRFTIGTHFLLLENDTGSYSVILSVLGVKNQIQLLLVDHRTYPYEEPIIIDHLRVPFCSRLDESEELLATFDITGIEATTELNQTFYLVTGKLTIKPIGECTGLFILIRTTGEIFPLSPMSGCGDLGTTTDFFVARYRKNEHTLPFSLYFDVRSLSVSKGFSLTLSNSWCSVVHEGFVPKSNMSSFRRMLQPRPVIIHESADTVYERLELEYQNSLIPDETYKLFEGAIEYVDDSQAEVTMDPDDAKLPPFIPSEPTDPPLTAPIPWDDSTIP